MTLKQLNNLYEDGKERKTMIDKEIRAILGRLINAGTLRNRVNGFELRETARHYKHGETYLSPSTFCVVIDYFSGVAIPAIFRLAISRFAASKGAV